MRGENTVEFANNCRRDRCRTRLHLHDQLRRIKTKWTPTGEDVDPAVRAGERDLGEEALGVEDRRHEVGEAMTTELLGDARLDLIAPQTLNVNTRLGGVSRVNIVAVDRLETDES